MSIDIVKDQINKFVKSDVCDVMAIKGGWGVGKTYNWKKLLKEAKDANNVAHNKYSYVSLFGINSLDAFKYTIFENVVDKNLIGTEASVKTFKDNSANLSDSLGRKAIKLLSGVRSIAPAIESLSFLSLNKTLICIDDLERRGAGLEIRDVLGLVSLLKEQKECKIVILLNDGEEGLEDYVKYREKVIDIELIYAPTPEECVYIAFDKNDYESNTLKVLAQKLGIKNIRVLKKIENLAYMMKPLLESYEEETKYHALHSLTLFSWCYYCSATDKKVPDLDYILKNRFGFLASRDVEGETEDQKSWKILLQDYNYSNADSFDKVISESVCAGFIVEEEFIKNAKLINDDEVIAKSDRSFTKAWDLYHGSFDNNTDEVINGIFESFKENASNISLINLNGTVSLFKELDEGEKATELIEFYIHKKKDETNLFNLKKSNFFDDKIDSEIEEKFDIAYEALKTNKTALEILNEMVVNNTWSDDDLKTLANVTVDEYYDLFKSIRGRQLSSYVKKCLRFIDYGSPEGYGAEINNRAKEALIRIASESEINRRRISNRYGIELDK